LDLASGYYAQTKSVSLAIVHASLPTRGTLLKRGLQIDPICPLCNADIEDMDHLFLCLIVQEVWRLAKDHDWVPYYYAFSFIG